MKRVKQIFGFLLTFVIMVAVLPNIAFSADARTEKDTAVSVRSGAEIPADNAALRRSSVHVKYVVNGISVKEEDIPTGTYIQVPLRVPYISDLLAGTQYADYIYGSVTSIVCNPLQYFPPSALTLREGQNIDLSKNYGNYTITYTTGTWSAPGGGGGSGGTVTGDFILQFDPNCSDGVINMPNPVTGTRFGQVRQQNLWIPGNIPQRNGYTFTGWNTLPNGTGTTYQPGKNVLCNLGTTTLYAQWTPDDVPVKPIVAGNTTIHITKVFAGDCTSAPAGFALLYAYTNLATDTLVTGTVPMTGSGSTLTGSIQVPYYNNAEETASYLLTFTEVNADISSHSLQIQSQGAADIDQENKTVAFAVSMTRESTLNRTIINTYQADALPDPKAQWDQLTIQKTADPDTAVKPGDHITYRITVTNNTGRDLTDITVLEKLNENLAFVSAVPAAQYHDGSGIWTIPALADGENAVLVITAAVNSSAADGAKILNTAVITGAAADADDKLPENDSSFSASAEITVANPPAPVMITIHFVDEDGNQIAEDTTVTVNKNRAYDVTEEAAEKQIRKWIYDRTEGNLTGIADENKEIYVYYTQDINEDGIADKYQVKVTFRVTNGAWDDGTDEEKVAYFTKFHAEGSMAEDGTAIVDTVPAAGNRPDSGYAAGDWDAVPSHAALTADAVYTYTYIPQVIQYTVSYDLNGGTAPEGLDYGSQKVDSGASILVKAAPVMDGFDFAGWGDGSGSFYQPGETIPVKRDLTLTAQWKRHMDTAPQTGDSGTLILVIFPTFLLLSGILIRTFRKRIKDAG